MDKIYFKWFLILQAATWLSLGLATTWHELFILPVLGFFATIILVALTPKPPGQDS